MTKSLIGSFYCCVIMLLMAFAVATHFSEAANVISYSDLLSDSAPSATSNHTLSFEILSSMPASSYFDFTPPVGFETYATSTFSVRNIEMYVDGSARTATTTATGVTDGVVITSGSPGSIRYTLNSSTGVTAGSNVEFRFGNHTTNSLDERTVLSGTSSTTTLPADVSGITNSAATGTHDFSMVGVGGPESVSADFVIAVIKNVGAGPLDTTEEIPPFRFGGAPTGTISGTSLNVEISLETDEFADCKFAASAGVEYASMPFAFNSSGLVIHSAIVSVSPSTFYQFFVRCIDDEDNINNDDYIIEFSVNNTPTGNPNAEGEVEGDGTGTGNDGTGAGEGGGGTIGGTEGETSTTGPTSGGGGDGGGGGGGGGSETNSSQPGGGFEGTGPYESGDGRVIISGLAYPRSTVTILVDGAIADTTRAGIDGTYDITIDEIARGVYTFGVYATDDDSTKSSTFSTSFTVSGARASGLSNINLAPSIKVDPDPVDVGSTVTFSGFTQPSAVVQLESQRESSTASLKNLTATADEDGRWSTTLSTAGFTSDTYQVRARATPPEGVLGNFSNWTFYGVGQNADVPINADLNRDGSVNLTDFSILLFWWGTDGGVSDPPADINRDGNVSLTDFSILLFNWTG